MSWMSVFICEGCQRTVNIWQIKADIIKGEIKDVVNPNNSSNGKAQKTFYQSFSQKIKQHEIIHQFLVTSLIQFNNKCVHG